VAVYVIAVAAFAVMLYVSFRSLAMEPAGGGDGGVAMEKLLARVIVGAQEVATSLALTELAGPVEGEDPLTAGARSGRKRMTGYEQQMSRLDIPTLSPDLAEARDLVAAAVEDLSWACRMAESVSYGENVGLQNGAAGLCVHARRCLDEGRRRLSQLERK